MRKAIAIVAGIVILVLVDFSIYSRERLLTEGSVVFLELAPVDPRSLMQGDYMALRFQVENALRASARESELKRDGLVVVALDERRVGSYARVDLGTPANSNEMKIRFRLRNDRVKFATNAYFFQEGTAQLYSKARYGEFRVDGNGDALLTALRDEKLAPLGVAADGVK
ncbi:MAG TPA: GDYXXLXY domain-containing protein [Burkholderiales bacterium]|nr:GDYXXLXY domain-containing protein [Burkholderiales bacterium]